MNFWRKIRIISFLALATVVFVFIYVIYSVTNRSFASNDLFPTIKITLNGVSLDELKEGNKETKYEGNNLEFIDVNGSYNFSGVQVKGRGNSTWGTPKPPLQIKFEQKIDLLGLGPRKKYILLANHIDYSNLRNDVLFKMTDMIGEEYRATGEFVELYINDDYLGLYYLTTKTEIGKGSVDLRDEYAGLFELDTLHAGFEDCYYSGAGECLIIKDAKSEDLGIRELIMADFVEKFSLLEEAAKRGDFADVSDVADVKSLAGYFLISEFASNPDAHNSSFNFYKDGFSDKIHAGPLWDYDFAFGNREWIWGVDSGVHSPEVYMVHGRSILAREETYSDVGCLMYYLIEMPEFREEVVRIFREKLLGRKNELIEYIQNRAMFIRGVALKDSDKWYAENRFDLEVEYLIDWVARKYEFLERMWI